MKKCRICFGTISSNDIYCKCNGTIKYIHKSCLEKLIYSRSNSNIQNCDICGYEFNNHNNNNNNIIVFLFLSGLFSGLFCGLMSGLTFF